MRTSWWLLGGALSSFLLALATSLQAQVLDTDPRYGSATLSAGFHPDPLVYDMKSGGKLSASHLGQECVGFLDEEKPDFAIFFEVGTSRLSVFVDGPTDTGLVINDPNGHWYCNDNAGGADGYQPAITFERPVSGRYDVWITEHQPEVYSEVRLSISEYAPAWGSSSDDGLGDDSGEYALDGECDDPRFGGTLESHRGHDATDCRGISQAVGDMGFGDDSGEYALDGVCDDPRFGGTLDSHRGRDASDCRFAQELGDSLGDDSGEYALDGECDDPRFGGTLSSHLGRDATDCRNASQAVAEDDFGDDSGEYALDGECDDPRFGGTLESHRGHDATDCRNSGGETQVATLEPEESAPVGTTLIGTGTGFFVSRIGHALTNNHVAGECNRVVLRVLGHEPMEAAVLAINVERDLALLKIGLEPPAWATFREGRAVRQGDEVVVYGFPIPEFVSAQGNLTAGLVTALSGGPNDLTYIQVSAQAGPGNSGGPVMDRAGNIVGVLSAGLNSQTVAERTGGYIPQNMNFAVRGSIARIFLDNNNVDYETSAQNGVLSIADIGDRARDFTAFVECYR